MQIANKTGYLQKIAFELRYRDGYVYLDRCGRTITDLLTEYPEWVVRDDGVSPQNAPLTSLVNGCVLNFSAKKLDLGIEKRAGGQKGLEEKDVAAFSKQAGGASELIIGALGIKDFERIGFRSWFLFPCKDLRESWSWLSSLKIFEVSQKFRDAISAELESCSLAFVFRGSRSYRVAVTQVEQTAQMDLGQDILSIRASRLHKDQRQVLHEQMRVKERMLANPEFAVMVDIDVYEEDAHRPGAETFISEAYADLTARLKSGIA
jgi:hypothetical protein